jgi:hypothetical protein
MAIEKLRRKDVSERVLRMLWGRSGGRCQFHDCNKPLWKSDVTAEGVNLAGAAHIWSYRPGGSRGNKGISPKLINKHENLLLACPECHLVIDKEKDGGRYTVAQLREWKEAHEARIELVTGIKPGHRSHVLHYGASVGSFAAPLKFEKTAPCLFPERFPADDVGIELGMRNQEWRDKEPAFYAHEGSNLVRRFERSVRRGIEDGTIDHVSVFGFAPQPLLILLGALITDIQAATVFQLHREPQGWSWAEEGDPLELSLDAPDSASGPPALVVALSATVDIARVHLVDPNYSVWQLRAAKPHNNIIQTRDQLRQVRTHLRRAFDEIKARHGNRGPLSVFPVAPVSVAVELGRVWMPKADLRLKVFDEQQDLGGFAHALDVPFATEKETTP